MTTIAWRLGHLGGMAVGGFADHRFGDAKLTTDQIDFPPRATAVPGFLDEHYQTWHAGLTRLTPSEWSAPLGQSWGPYADTSTIDLAPHVLDEVIHHGAEAGLPRDLYFRRSSLHVLPPLLTARLRLLPLDQDEKGSVPTADGWRFGRKNQEPCDCAYTGAPQLPGGRAADGMQARRPQRASRRDARSGWPSRRSGRPRPGQARREGGAARAPRARYERAGPGGGRRRAH